VSNLHSLSKETINDPAQEGRKGTGKDLRRAKGCGNRGGPRIEKYLKERKMLARGKKNERKTLPGKK